MKIFAACLLQFGFLLPLVFASLSAKAIAGTRVSKRERSSSSSGTKSQPINVRKDSSSNAPELLASILPTALVRIVIDYYFEADDEAYSVIVSVRNWLLKDTPEIAADNANVYMIGESIGIVGMDLWLSTANRLFDLYWSGYRQFNPSQDGRYFFLSYAVTSKKHSFTGKVVTSLHAQSDNYDDPRPVPVRFGGEHCDNGIMSRDGRTVCSYDRYNRTTRVYRVAEQDKSGKRAVSLKRELRNSAVAVSGRGNRVAVKTARSVNIYNIDTNTRVPFTLVSTGLRMYTLNGDGSEIAFAIHNASVRIIKVDNASDTVTILVPNPAERIDRLMYADGGKLYALYTEGQISLVDPKAKKFVPLQVPQTGGAIKMAISPSADYIVTLESLGNGDDSSWSLQAFKKWIREKTSSRPQSDGEAEQRHSFTHRMTVRRKLSKLDCETLLGIKG